MKALSRNMCKNFTYKKLLVKIRSLENLISPIHHKEGDRHDDVNDEEGQNSRDPGLEHVKTIAKQGRTKGRQDVAPCLR